MGGLRLKRGDYYADIISDNQLPNIWLYAVQHYESPEILAIGSCQSKEEACIAAGEVIGCLRAQKRLVA